jgi:hypothetical protein
MNISPIKYEIEANTWSIITKEAKLTNNSEQTFHIITWKSDFVANWEDWKPKFIRKSEEVFEQNLSNWITIDTNEFDIAPHETKIIHFTIQVPENTTPWGHYWAIFFKNKWSETSSQTAVGINVDYWILILVNVNWEIINDIEIEEPIIKIWHSWNVKHMDVCNETGWDKSWDYYDGKCLAPNTQNQKNNNKQENTENKATKDQKDSKQINKQKKDDCIVDLTSSQYDWKCIDNIDKVIKEITGNIEDLNFDKNKEKNNNDFITKIEIPIKNKWNTHVKPKWKIVLYDENGNIIKWVGKEVVTNKKWAIIWEKIVDYIPFNDIWWNVLPNTKRIYKSYWKGFPYKAYDEEWNLIIKYFSPSDYYSKKNLLKHRLIMPWQRVITDIKNKEITAKINIIYPWENWETEFNSSQKFNIKYIQQSIWLNTYFFAILLFILLIIYLIFIIFRKKKKRCIKCNKKIDKDMKICPYCWEKQKKKKKNKK